MMLIGLKIRHFMRAFKSLTSFIYVTRRLSRHFLDVMVHGRGMTLTNGNALAGRLAKAAMDRNIPVWLSSPVKKLVTEHDGVAGALVEHEGKSVFVRAKRGVVLACGGFPHDVERRKQLFPHAPTGKEHYSPSPAANTGDGLRLAEAVGGRVDPTIPHAAAWVPTSVTASDAQKGVMPHFIDRAKPGHCRHKGQALYQGTPTDFVSHGEGVRGRARCCVAAAIRGVAAYGLGASRLHPPIGRHLRSGYLKRGATVADLAQQIGLAPEALEATIREFNAAAGSGEDPAFGKGTKAYNRYQGDALVQPNPCVAPLEHGPYYAIRLVIGDIGTFAGLVTDENTQVLNAG
jgi:succinate dehydrogenase/fumarate reductase flavoprotein subunit